MTNALTAAEAAEQVAAFLAVRSPGDLIERVWADKPYELTVRALEALLVERLREPDRELRIIAQLAEERDRLSAELAAYERAPHPDHTYMLGRTEARAEADSEYKPWIADLEARCTRLTAEADRLRTAFEDAWAERNQARDELAEITEAIRQAGVDRPTVVLAIRELAVQRRGLQGRAELADAALERVEWAAGEMRSLSTVASPERASAFADAADILAAALQPQGAQRGPQRAVGALEGSSTINPASEVPAGAQRPARGLDATVAEGEHR